MDFAIQIPMWALVLILVVVCIIVSAKFFSGSN